MVGEDRALLSDAVDVWRLAHDSVGVGTGIPHANIITPDHENVGLPVSQSRTLFFGMEKSSFIYMPGAEAWEGHYPLRPGSIMRVQ